MQIVNTRGNDDADYQAKVRDAVMSRLKGSARAKPGRGGYFDGVVKKQEDGEEG